jgi:hypothetical protein
VEEALSELWAVKSNILQPYVVPPMTVASAGASITVSRACVNRFQKLLDHGQPVSNRDGKPANRRNGKAVTYGIAGS